MSTAVISLMTDWNNGEYKQLRAKDRKRARIFAPEYRIDSPENRRYLAMELGRNQLPAVVLDYEQLRDMSILYTVTRDDYEDYLRDADERDRATEDDLERARR
jgi:hypothetical protein